MTRKERKKAIEVLDDMKVKIDIPKAAKTQNDRNWALDVAIQTLSQEPTEKHMTVDEMEREYEKSKALFHKIVECEDTISRDDVEECKELMTDINGDTVYAVRMSDIRQLSSVKPQTECLKAQAKKQAMPMSCDDCCYEPNSPFCEMYRKDICEKKDEQKSGKWIPNYYFYGIYDYTCSECEKHSKERSAFCPKCGVKMKSEE